SMSVISTIRRNASLDQFVITTRPHEIRCCVNCAYGVTHEAEHTGEASHGTPDQTAPVGRDVESLHDSLDMISGELRRPLRRTEIQAVGDVVTRNSERTGGSLKE